MLLTVISGPSLSKPHQLFHQQQEKESGIYQIVLYLMNNTEITAISIEIGISAVLISLSTSRKSDLYAEILTPVCARLHNALPLTNHLRKAQKYISYTSHLHKYSDHACLGLGEKGATYQAFFFYCQIP